VTSVAKLLLRFSLTMPFGFGGLMLRWWVERGGGSRGFPRSTGRVDTEFVPIITVVANEVGDFAEGLVRYGVL